MSVQTSLWDPAFNFLGCVSRSRIAISYDNSIFIFWVIIILFSIKVVPFHILSNSIQGFQFFHTLTNNFFLLKKYISHSIGCEIVSHCVFFNSYLLLFLLHWSSLPQLLSTNTVFGRCWEAVCAHVHMCVCVGEKSLKLWDTVGNSALAIAPCLRQP